MSQSRVFGGEISEWGKIKTLVWKNWYLQWNNRVHLLFSIITPTLFLTTVVLLRFYVEIESLPVSKFNTVTITKAWTELIEELQQRYQKVSSEMQNFTYNTFIPRLIIAYAPSDRKAIVRLMQEALSDLPNVALVQISTCNALRRRMVSEHYLAGACFDTTILDMAVSTESLHLVNGFPNRLNYSIILPGEVRIYNDSYISAHWSTNSKYDNLHKRTKRIGKTDKGGYVGYIREGFVSLQNAISMAYIRLITTNQELPNIQIRRFPYRKRDYDPLTDDIDTCLSMMLMTGYIYPVAQLVQSIMHEKEKRLKGVMKILGVHNITHVIAWFINGLIMMSLSSVLNLIVLKVHWYEGYGILTQSSWLAIFFLLISYNIATVCYCLMMSSIFHNTSSAIGISALTWLIMYTPYMSTVGSSTESVGTLLLSFLFLNSAMGFAMNIIVQFESIGKGFHMNNFFDQHIGENRLTVGSCLITLYAVSLLYASIGLIVEVARRSLASPATLRKVWRYIITSLMPHDRPHLTFDEPRQSSGNTTRYRMTKVYEIEPTYKTLTVQVKHLTKEYKGHSVLKDIVINLYENEITILMGHNGSGKTTLISMILGLIVPTNGTAIINGYDIFQNPTSARSSLGISFSDNTIYDELSVANQLRFFSLIKGMNVKDAESEVEKFISAMKLGEQRNVLTKDLSDSLRQHLAVCCALAGKSKIVMLDDPSLKMDLENRKLFWKMLHKEKEGRTILMTTHSTTEAEILSDRVAILSDGELKCTGTAAFLHNVYGSGYRLSCFVAPDCDPDAVTAKLQKYIPNIVPDGNVGNEITYSIAERYMNVCGELLGDLEKWCQHLHIDSFSLNTIDMEDIFYRLGAENPGEDDRTRYSQISQGQSSYVEEYDHFRYVDNFEPLHGWKLCLRQWHAIMYKRFVSNIRNKSMLSAQITMPILFTCVSFIVPSFSTIIKHLEPIAFTPRQYDQSATVMERRNLESALMKMIAEKYRQILFWLGFEHKVVETQGNPMTSFIIAIQEEQPFLLSWKYKTAVTFGTNYITAWFNNFPLHTAPLSLNLVHNAILRALLDNNARIMVSFHPLPLINPSAPLKPTATNLGSFLAINLIFCVCFTWCHVISYLAQERNSGFKLMQYMAGIRVGTFFLASFTYDFIKIVITVILVMLTITSFQDYIFRQVHISIWYGMVLLLGGVSLYSFNYFIAICFKDSINAYIIGAVANIFGCVNYYTLLNVLGSGYNGDIEINEAYVWMLRLFPGFSLYSALIKIYNTGEITRICQNREIVVISNTLEKCQSFPNCCKNKTVFDWDDGVTIDVIWLLTVSLLCWTMILASEHRIWQYSFFPWSSKNDHRASALVEHRRRHNLNEINEQAMNNNVAAEIAKVNNLQPKDYYNLPLVCDHVGKFKKNVAVVDRFTLAVERAECVSIIGCDDMAKTTLLRMLIRQEQMSYGRVFINGLNLKDDMHKVYQHMSFTPQFNGFMVEYTGAEYLKILSLLRGMPIYEIEPRCKMLVKMLGVYRHYYKILQNCSEGNQKRIVCAGALLGNISIALMDHPTTHVDPAGRTQMFNVFDILRERGTSVLCSSANEHLSQRYCNRLVILTNGRISNIGSPYSLGKKLSTGYILHVKMRITSADPSRIRRHYQNLIEFVETEFYSATLRDHYCKVYTFNIPSETSTIKQIFQKMNDNIFTLNIDTFLITCGKRVIQY